MQTKNQQNQKRIAPFLLAFLTVIALMATGAASWQLATVIISDDGDGAIQFLGASTGFDNDLVLNLDDVDNEAGVSTAVVTNLNLTAIGIKTTGAVTGGAHVNTKAAGYTLGTDDAREAYGGVIYVTAAATITLPAVASGMSVTIITIGAVAVSVDPNAADLLVLDGVTLADGDKATNTSTTGDMIVLTYYNSTGWYASSDGWTDTN